MSRKLDTKEFITRARAVHGDKYNYDKVIYDGCSKKVIITCPIHGDFMQLPGNHVSLKQGCDKCAREKKAKVQTKTTEEFIARARAVHGDKYNYDKVIYEGNDKKVIITCPIHGDFPQTPNKHKGGQGCPYCALEKSTKSRRKTTEEFIAEARAVHGDKYSYDNVNYINNKIEVMITCPIHGDFSQRPCHHLSGCGCYKCKASHLEEQTRTALQKNNITFEPQKTFEWLISTKKHKMFLDFYLPEYDIAIECQGIQHYKTTGMFTRDIVNKIQQRDTLKYELCQEHNIPLYYINYNDNVEEKLNVMIKLISNLK